MTKPKTEITPLMSKEMALENARAALNLLLNEYHDEWKRGGCKTGDESDRVNNTLIFRAIDSIEKVKFND